MFVLSVSLCASQMNPAHNREAVAIGFPQARTFAPYVDVTNEDLHLVSLARASGVRHFMLSFLTARRGSCELRWGGYLPLAHEDSITAQILDLRNNGGDAAIALGGEVGRELAQTCKDAAQLRKEYQAVLNKYRVRQLDFDIEAGGAKDMASIDRRNLVLSALQKANPDLQISFTLAATPDGLTPEGMNLLRNAKQRGVKIALVNIMAMNYGGSAPSKEMARNAISAALKTAAQMKSMGLNTGLGITVMIGRNNVKGEVFTLADARELTAFARTHAEVRMLSMWSLGRDRSCPKGTSVSPACSGVPQKPFDFAHIFEDF